MSQFTTSNHRESIPEGHAEFGIGDVIENTKFGGKFRISSMCYDKRQDAIVYKVMKLRERFNMFEIAEYVVLRNVDKGTMVVIKR